MWNHIDNYLIQQGYSKSSTRIMMNSVRDSSKKQYGVYIKQYLEFTSIPILDSNHKNLIQFLEHLYNKDLGYSAINTARSAVSTMMELLGKEALGKHRMVCRFMKGIFNEKPALPRYVDTWDPDIILKHLDKTSEGLSLLELSKKVTTLITILSSQRVSTIASLKTDDISFSEQGMTIRISVTIKQTKPGHHQKPLQFTEIKDKKNICAVHQLRLYLRKTANIRTSEKLFITSVPPHKAAKKDTIANWIRDVMKSAGINTRYGPHSLRTSSASKAAASLPIDRILQAGGWRSESVFRQYYNKPIAPYTGIDRVLLTDKN